jgi:predicted nucleic acid-binding protein
VRHYFFDSSTFLKLFVVEAGDKRVRAIMHAAETANGKVRVAVCDLAHPESTSALRQMVERGVGGRRGISSASLRRTLPVIRRFFTKGTNLTVIEASTVIPESAELAVRYQVRGADAVHIAAAQQVHRRVKDEEFWFVSADVRQAAAARLEGMPVLDPTAS